jgi:uncharacterized protein YbbC (DUF1343 family)
MEKEFFGMMNSMVLRVLFIFILSASLFGEVSLGVDVFFEQDAERLKDKKIGLIINQTSVDSKMRPTLSRFQDAGLTVAALFSPEHGLKGQHYAAQKISNGKEAEIPVYSLHGDQRRPSKEMLAHLDAIVYDIQCTGVRAYTYQTTLYYAMEEAAKAGVEVIVFDRPNPINGLVVDGPMLEEKRRSFIGYINVPYCPGMTIGELAKFFNAEYKIGCKLSVIPMKGWKRAMSYRDTGLSWIPPSPNVPEPDTPLFYPITGLLGELGLVSIGIGYTLPFKIVGAPWIKAQEFAAALNSQKLPGVRFQPFHFRPFYGHLKGLDCEGVLIQITDVKIFRPLSTQFLIIGLLKSLYPAEFKKRMDQIVESRKDLFSKANGTDAIYDIIQQEKFPAWKLIDFQKGEREAFLEKRKAYLLYD